MTATARDYHRTHRRLRRAFGRAGDQRCARCGGPASDWAYDGTDPVEERVRTYDGRLVRYSGDLDRYEPLCKGCHHAQDSPPKTRCNHGHELTPDNVYVRPDGTRLCRQCKRETLRHWRAEHPDWRTGVRA